MMSTPEERFSAAAAGASVEGTSTARLTSTTVNEEGKSTSYVFTTSALCARERWLWNEPDSGRGCSLRRLEDAAVFVVDDVLTGPAVDSTDAASLEAIIKAALIADDDYPSITTGSAAMRKIVAIAGAIMGVCSLDDDNTITLIDKV